MTATKHWFLVVGREVEGEDVVKAIKAESRSHAILAFHNALRRKARRPMARTFAEDAALVQQETEDWTHILVIASADCGPERPRVRTYSIT